MTPLRAVLPQGLGDIGVQVGEGLHETGGVSRFEALADLPGVRRVASVIGDAGGILSVDVQTLRFLLHPFGAAPIAEQAQPQAVAMAQGGLADPERAPQAVPVFHPKIGVVHDAGELGEMMEIRVDGSRGCAAQERGQMMHVDRQVQKDGGYLSVPQAPGLGVHPFRGLNETVGGELHLQLQEPAQGALEHVPAQVPDHWVAAVVVGDGEEPPGLQQGLSDALGLCQVGGHGLLADHRDTGPQQAADDIGMIRGGCQHHHRIQSFALPCHQGLPVRMQALRLDAPLLGRFPVDLGMAAEAAGDHLPAAVQLAGHPVGIAHGGIEGASDEAELQGLG
jgi:hypothetical protein